MRLTLVSEEGKSMKDFLETGYKLFEKMSNEFTWLKLVSIVLFFAISMGAFVLFERYTSHFHLTRLEKATH
jgi:hypothetical protein